MTHAAAPRSFWKELRGLDSAVWQNAYTKSGIPGIGEKAIEYWRWSADDPELPNRVAEWQGVSVMKGVFIRLTTLNLYSFDQPENMLRTTYGCNFPGLLNLADGMISKQTGLTTLSAELGPNETKPVSFRELHKEYRSGLLSLEDQDLEIVLDVMKLGASGNYKLLRNENDG